MQHFLKHFDDEGELITEKKCLKCQNIKNFEEFTLSKSGRFGRHNWCRECLSQYNKEKYKEGRDEKIQKSELWNRRNPKKVRRIKNNYWRRKHPDAKRYNVGQEIPDKPEIDF